MSRLTVQASTPLCLLQDAGRFGVRHLGVTQGGALDWVAMAWANWLLGNAPGAAVVEVALGGLTLLAEEDCQLALAGADLDARIDGEPLQPWRNFMLRRGQALQLHLRLSGARAYLAAPGGFDAPTVLGSCSTVVREALGGLDGQGRALQVGATLGYRGPLGQTRGMPRGVTPVYSDMPRLDLIMGAQLGEFAGQSLFDAFNLPWTLDSRGDRMGIRLSGPALQYQGKALISEGIPLGGVQVPPDGQPIVLLNDRQTIGGYPRLGALTPLALARLAQCLPGDEVRLKVVVQEGAVVEHQRFMTQFA
ncbi:biotin-dependent carboxyltransferase family protein [Pseudomonas sp. dw_358]|uniref:5-oxoprolinase subunit C family protein n=1 Tax=Pseudomonas sp. dw_358 TaxID=2720083 RepID=UPI001BD31095|nr:biotin-dependent carboxyltransferase family protein [Pseudomonas sp. dw_358]